MPEWLVILLVLALLFGLGWWRTGRIDARRGVMPYSALAGQHKSLPGSAPDDSLHGAGESSSDDEWAAQLHAINLLVSHKVWSWFQEKMVPVSEVTHYEVEALIGQLGVAEWVPGRYRMAA